MTIYDFANNNSLYKRRVGLENLADRISGVEERLDQTYSNCDQKIQEIVIVRKNMSIYKALQQKDDSKIIKTELKDKIISDVNNEILRYQLFESGQNKISALELMDTRLPIWHQLARKYDMHFYQIINIWVNRFPKKKTFDQRDDAEILCLIKDRGHMTWLHIGAILKIPPFQAFKRYVALQAAKNNQRVEWSIDEDSRLKEAVSRFGEGKWTKIAKFVVSKGPRQCMFRYRNTLKEGARRGKWSLEEDQRLLHAISLIGTKCWRNVAEIVRTRTDFQCRERYTHNLDPNINKETWSFEEDQMLFYLCERLGTTRWSEISKNMKNRSDVQCRRRYMKLISIKEPPSKNTL